MKMLKGTATEPILILVAVLIVSIAGIIIFWEESKPTLTTSLEAKAKFVAHALASYIGGLSTAEQGRAEKDLNGSFDIEIGKYPWSRRTFTSIKPLTNYYIKVTAYDSEWKKKRDSGQVPFVGELSLNCPGTGTFRATKCKVFKNISFVMLSKKPNRPVEISTTPTFAISPVSIPNEFIAKYNVYKDAIGRSVRDPGHDLTKYHPKPEALVAGLISHESGWNPSAVSPCGAAGLMQFTPPTARNYNLKVPNYPFVECRMDLCGKLVSECNSCTPDKCRMDEDERFDPEKAIEAGVRHLYDAVSKCGGVEAGLRMYNSGNCYKEANPGYVSKVLSYAKEWEKYV